MKANGYWRWPPDRAPARNVLRPAELISRGAWFAPAAGEVKHLRKTEDLPQLPGFDHTLAFLRSGYAFVGQRCDELGTDRFATRLMLRPVICARGEAAAELVYDAERVTRQGAMPPTVLRLLQDKGSVQQLDGAAHRQRKALFTGLLMSDAAEAAFVERFRAVWIEAMARWRGAGQVVLYDEMHPVLTTAICDWVGMGAAGRDDAALAGDLRAMIENTSSVGPRVVFALARRSRTERRLRELIEKVRAAPESDTPLSIIAHFRDPGGALLPVEVAAVELLNVLRPTVAVARYIAFAALALHEHPDWREALRGAPASRFEHFAEEVRRFYPFFPVIGGVARRGFDWEGIGIAKGQWMLLDLYATTHDPRYFPEPQVFSPGRELSWRGQDHRFIPQGAGDAHVTHRCPGERLTVAAIREATRMLVEEMDYEVPAQDLTVSLKRIPARPASGMVLRWRQPAV